MRAPVRAALRPGTSSSGIVPVDLRQPYDVREVIARIVDGSEFDEFKALLRHHARHRLRRISGACRSASSPTTASCFRESALKGAHFIELCCQRGIPLVFLQNITGFMVGAQIRGRRHRQGRRQDGDRRRHRARAEIHRHHRRLLRRRQLRHVRARLSAALPVDVAERAHLRDGRRAGGQRAGDRPARRHRSRRRGLAGRGGGSLQGADPRSRYDSEGHPYYATARLWDDGIIDPGGDAARAGARPFAPRSTRRSSRRASASSGCERHDVRSLVSSPIAAKSPAASSAPRAGWASHHCRLFRCRCAARCHVRAGRRGRAHRPGAGAGIAISTADRIIAAASAAGAEAIHPGYGFLSENAEFAEACAAGRHRLRRAAGAAPSAPWASKIAAKALMEAAGVPLVPGLSRRRSGRRRSLRGGGRDRLSGADQGGRRRRRQGHAPRRRGRRISPRRWRRPSAKRRSLRR